MKTFPIVPCLFFVLNAADAQISFHKTYGGMGQDHASCIRQTTDGGYIAAGFTPGIGASNNGGYIVKTDQNGDTLWTRIFGGNYMDDATQVQQTTDGGYIISGTSTYSSGSSDISLIKINANGNITWNKRYNASMVDQGNSVFQTFDGGYILAGNTNSSSDFCLIKTDAIGNITWSKITGGPANDFCKSVIQTNDSGYVITGWTESFVVIPTIFIAKYTAAGSLEWMKTYKENSGNTVTGFGYAVQQTTDGGFIVIGNKENNGLPETWLLKTDALGNLLWNKSYGGNYKDISRSVCQTTDGGYIIGMSVLNTTAVDFDICLIKTDASGNVSWSSVYGDSADENVYSVRQTTDGGYIIGGDKFSASNDFDLYFIKTDVNGNSGCFENSFSPVTATGSVLVTMQSPFDSSGFTISAPMMTVDYGGEIHSLCNTTGIDEYSNNYSIRIYPNPTIARFIVQSDDPRTHLVITNIYGQVIFDYLLISNETEIDLSSHPPGVYLCELSSKNKQKRSVKLVLE